MFDFLKSRYQKIKSILFGKVPRENLEELLYEADLGSAVIQELMQTVEDHPKATDEELMILLQKQALAILEEPPSIPATTFHKPFIILLTGVNGSGKTTTAAKLAAHYQKLGKKVLVAAGDTFRAAATEQLEIWAKRLEFELVKGRSGADPSSVIFDALKSSEAKGIDVVIADTAGRLDSKIDLMKELDKIYRVMKKFDLDAPHEVLLVLDATFGQNAKEQALTFHKYAPLTGFVVSKLDGSAKGGALLGLYREMGIPIKWIGTGEGVEDLVEFNPRQYVEALFQCSP